MNFCIIIPTYNNAGTLLSVIERIPDRFGNRIVVDDGSDDGTAEILSENADRLHCTVVTHGRNLGKGRALLSGFAKAREMGCSHAVTIDADGQHYPEDIPAMVSAAEAHPEAIIVGRRNLTADGMPSGNTFANRFSNFWFHLQTLQNPEDTQSGFRVYPLDRLHWLGMITSRYEAELELMVFAAWNGTGIVSEPVRVYYPPEGLRISHFRPVADFARISVLNTLLCLGALCYGYPSMLVRKLTGKVSRPDELNCDE